MDKLGLGGMAQIDLVLCMLKGDGLSCSLVSEGSGISQMAVNQTICLQIGTRTTRSSYYMTFLTRIYGDLTVRKRGPKGGDAAFLGENCEGREQLMVIVGLLVGGTCWIRSWTGLLCKEGRSFSDLGCGCWMAEKSSSTDSNPISFLSISYGSSLASLSPRSRSNLQSVILVGEGCTKISLKRGDSSSYIINSQSQIIRRSIPTTSRGFFLQTGYFNIPFIAICLLEYCSMI